MAHAELEIIASAFEAATHEMAASLVRTAFSPNVKERADCSTAICDASGRALSWSGFTSRYACATRRSCS